MPNKLVILGAGMGGLNAVQELKQRGFCGHANLEVVLIDRDFSHFLGFTLPWIMRGWRTPKQSSIVPSEKSLSGVQKITGTVTKIDSVNKQVIGDGFKTNYDALIIALGSKNNPGKIPGLAEAVNAGVAHHFYSIADAAKAHQALTGFTGGKVAVLVPSLPFRCPVAPYEGAMLVHDYLSEHGRRAGAQIDVFTVEPQPMPSAGTSPGQKLIALLSDSNIDFHPNMRCQSVDAATKKINFVDGTSAEFDLLLFVPPHEPALGLDGETGWIAVDHRTLATEKPGIWAIGDVSNVTTPSGRPLPKAAIMAKGHAKAAVANALQYLGLAPENDTFDGEGYCFIDTGNHQSTRGIGNFYALPEPAVELVPSSAELHELKKQEERDWAQLWS
ncbi:NAD(P)/FAD-dependent oxidoreductase [Mycobacterium paraintracellulare]|uniref:NAD(P)/FAD-dependent oxidoreductase n=1 Tax=Mycobacterium paraintracellulare TaxID=1138383 RepID=UPI0019153083|nr:FAD/NAD(P)-binding oxidoreductase [Mycobacterium paraintracellulare]